MGFGTALLSSSLSFRPIHVPTSALAPQIQPCKLPEVMPLSRRRCCNPQQRWFRGQ